jgi:hypothetical protein
MDKSLFYPASWKFLFGHSTTIHVVANVGGPLTASPPKEILPSVLTIISIQQKPKSSNQKAEATKTNRRAIHHKMSLDHWSPQPSIKHPSITGNGTIVTSEFANGALVYAFRKVNFVPTWNWNEEDESLSASFI